VNQSDETITRMKKAKNELSENVGLQDLDKLEAELMTGQNTEHLIKDFEEIAWFDSFQKKETKGNKS
jgi:cell fate (sporulation/competence/biofilm development) regulator YmcA (YheA/YmcA/DUF963 family)